MGFSEYVIMVDLSGNKLGMHILLSHTLNNYICVATPLLFIFCNIVHLHGTAMQVVPWGLPPLPPGLIRAHFHVLVSEPAHCYNPSLPSPSEGGIAVYYGHYVTSTSQSHFRGRRYCRTKASASFKADKYLQESSIFNMSHSIKTHIFHSPPPHHNQG